MEFLQIWMNHDIKQHRKTGFKRTFGYFGQNRQAHDGPTPNRKMPKQNMGKSAEKMLAEEIWELPPLCIGAG
jgi:hypothetical protein